jgi:class 3 adenylate cyclase/predicted ATPase
MPGNTVREWLAAIGLPRYVEQFEKDRIELDVLSELTDADLRDIGVPLGDRKRLLSAIRLRFEVQSAPKTAAPPERAETPAATAERRQLTVMFCDLVGSTALTQQLDPEHLRDLMHDYQQACGAVVDKFDGHVAQYLGDGLMVYFGWPRAHEDDAERAVRASLEIIEAVKRVRAPERLSVRIGIATGSVVVGESADGDASVSRLAVGETPNLAARLQGLAGPDEIVVARNSHRLLGAAFEYRYLGAHALKGVVEPVHAWRVVALKSIEDRFEATRGEVQLTPLVGREEEIARLRRRWEDAKSGDGQVVLLCGEPGIGKSRITYALREHIEGGPCLRLRYQCSPFHTQSALYPVIDHLERAAGLVRDDTPEQKLDKLEALLLEGLERDDIPTIAPLYAALLSLPAEGRYCAPNDSSQKQKERTLEALFGQVVGLSKRQPLLVVFEDAHWIDPTTQESLDMLVARIAQHRVLLLITYRPEYVPPWSGEPHVTAVTLSRLSPKLGAQLAGKVTGGKSLPQEVLDQIVAKTDGVPLFVEELTKAVLESELLEDSGDHYVLHAPLPPLAIPSTLHDSLMARLDRLASVKELAQIGACIGRQFSHELIAAVSRLPEPRLSMALEQLVQSQLIFRQGSPPSAAYTFKHALVQDTAYGSLLKSRRVQIHSTIANVLVEQFAADAEQKPEFVAHHYAQAGLGREAIEYWRRAGQRAMQHAAHAEALAHCRSGLEVLAWLPASSERDDLELTLQIALANALIHAKGWSATETADAFARAERLSHTVGDAARTFRTVYGMWSFWFMRGDQREARKYADHSLLLANATQETEALINANVANGVTACLRGDFASAPPYFEKATALYGPQYRPSITQSFGRDPRISASHYLALTLHCLGHVDRALELAREMTRFADQTQHPFHRAWSLIALSMLCVLRGDAQGEAGPAARSVALSLEQGFTYFAGLASAWHGADLAQSGQVESGEALLRAGLSGTRAVGSEMGFTILLAHRARALLLANAAMVGLEVVAEGLALVEKNDEHWGEAELYRVKGDLLLAQTQPDPVQAEACYRQALAVARSQQAKSWELRAAMGLARLWHGQSKRREAFDLVALTYDWFTDGFGTRDLIQATALLEELR